MQKKRVVYMAGMVGLFHAHWGCCCCLVGKQVAFTSQNNGEIDMVRMSNVIGAIPAKLASLAQFTASCVLEPPKQVRGSLHYSLALSLS